MARRLSGSGKSFCQDCSRSVRQVAWAVVAVGVMMTLKNYNYRRLQSAAVAFPAMSCGRLIPAAASRLSTP